MSRQFLFLKLFKKFVFLFFCKNNFIYLGTPIPDTSIAQSLYVSAHIIVIMILKIVLNYIVINK